jgi:hypothetical protein
MKRTIRRLLIPTLLALLIPVASAGALTLPTTTTTTTTTTPPPPKTKSKKHKPAPAPKKGNVTLLFPDAFFVNHDAVIVPNRGLDVHGVVRPYVAGQKVTVKATIGNKVLKTETLRVKPSKNGTYGQFWERLVTSDTGNVTVTATHSRTKAQYGFDGKRGYAVLNPNVGFGSSGPFVLLMQQQLRALHFYLIETGTYDGHMGLALDAYHRLLGWGHSQSLDSKTVSYLLNGWGSFKVRYPNQGHHIEGDLANQVLAEINGSQVYALYPISSGKPSTPTVLGSFQVYRRTPGYLPDGMYYSSFFVGGYAIHGYNPAPDYPASHGCMRLPISDAISVYDWIQMGDWVDTYY